MSHLVTTMEDDYTYVPLQKGEIRLLEIMPGQRDNPFNVSYTLYHWKMPLYPRDMLLSLMRGAKI